MSEKIIVCTPKALPKNLWADAARTASRINPVNHPPVEKLGLIIPNFTLNKEYISILTTKYWHTKGVNLTVGFLDNPTVELKSKILLHMNAWGKTANVSFVESGTDQKVRISRETSGYWSYLGTDILSIPAGEPTMSLEGFTIDTPDSEFYRVVRHETGHTIGCPHEHMRKEFVDRIDPQKAIEFYLDTQGWDENMVRSQVLTSLEESSLLGTQNADQNSIMCYQIPGTITIDGNPILGGTDIDAQDYDFMSHIYPK
jgi:Astacin (Peptidase family M12A)